MSVYRILIFVMRLMRSSSCLCVPPYFSSVFHEIRVVLKESRRLVLTTTFCFILNSHFQSGVRKQYTYTLLVLPHERSKSRQWQFEWFNKHLNINWALQSEAGARGSEVGWSTMLQAGGLQVRFPMRSLFFNYSSRTMALGSTQPLREMNRSYLAGYKWRPAPKADILTAICEPTV
jgi:hypothetical protein